MSVNKVIILGRVGRDPEFKETSGGDLAHFSMATSYRQKDREEVTEWHNIVVFGRLTDVVGKYVFKGDLLYVEGRLRTRKWTDKNGDDRSTTEIVADRIELLGRSSKRTEEQDAPRKARAADAGVEGLSDDIPF